ncbi:hypothetical protein [Priestia megaterium]|uniref:hypothetical protein n=1 Tax=Priestia megaterium TaxID=1404 RepID=UPI0023DC8391|nr:hypothetical protein [Priestia megaterium]MDF2010192.1 hypothetical protein [Priestia megaterium]
MGYGYLKLTPDTLWSLSTREFVDMYEAYIEREEETFDLEMQRTSWFTSLLMNATGNYKKEIKPDKLYQPLEKQKTQTEEYQKEYVEKQREALKEKFNIG